MIYSWEKGFIKDKEEERTQVSEKDDSAERRPTKEWSGAHKTFKGKNLNRNRLDSQNVGKFNLQNTENQISLKRELIYNRTKRKKQGKTHQRNHKRSCRESALPKL